MISGIYHECCSWAANPIQHAFVFPRMIFLGKPALHLLARAGFRVFTHCDSCAMLDVILRKKFKFRNLWRSQSNVRSQSNYSLTIRSIRIIMVATEITNQFRHLTTWNMQCRLQKKKRNVINFVDCLLTVCYLLLLYT